MTVNKTLRIKNGMSIEDTIKVMSNYDLDYMRPVMEIMCLSAGMAHLIELDIVGIYGEKLNELWVECCDRDEAKFEKVMATLFTEEYADLDDATVRADLKEICNQILND